MLDVIYGAIVLVVDILKEGNCSHLCYDPSPQSIERFGVIAFQHHLITELRKHGFYPPASLFKDGWPGPVSVLVSSHRGLYLDPRLAKQVHLPVGRQIAFIG